jgi:urease accessory protein
MSILGSRSRLARVLVALAALVLPALASAHEGHGAHDLGAGLLHPLTGLDHLLAIVAVGWWSAGTQTRRWWAIPLAFSLAMLAGAIAGTGREPPAPTEPAIVASLLLFGALLAGRVTLALPFAIALVLPFAAMHGHAHGGELANASATPWLAGMALATLALHIAGAFAGWKTRERLRWATPLAGAVGIAAGLVLAYGLLLG